MNYLIGGISGIAIALGILAFVYKGNLEKCQKENEDLRTQILMLGQASTRMMAIVHSRDSIMQPFIAKTKFLNEKYNKPIDTVFIGDMDSLLRELTNLSEPSE